MSAASSAAAFFAAKLFEAPDMGPGPAGRGKSLFSAYWTTPLRSRMLA